jgi:hypothetical protein
MGLGDDLRALARYEFELERNARKARAPRRIAGICAYCGEPGKDLVTDHDHETGQIRASNVTRLADYLNRSPNLGPYRPGRRG